MGEAGRILEPYGLVRGTVIHCTPVVQAERHNSTLFALKRVLGVQAVVVLSSWDEHGIDSPLEESGQRMMAHALLIVNQS